MGQLGRHFRFGSRVVTALPADSSVRPWDFVQRGLAAVGLSGRGLVIAAPAVWMDFLSKLVEEVNQARCADGSPV